MSYNEIRKKLKSNSVDELRHALECSVGEFNAGQRSNKVIDRIHATRDELKERTGMKVLLPNSLDPTVLAKSSNTELPLEYRIAVKYKQLFDSARKRKKEFSLTLDDVKRLLTRENCAYTGQPFEQDNTSPLYRTIDRLDPSEGYTSRNVFAVSARANHVKNKLFEEVGGPTRMPIREVMLLCSTLQIMNFKENEL